MMKFAARWGLCALLALGGAGCAAMLSEADKSDPGIKARLEAKLRAGKFDTRKLMIDVHSRVITIDGIVESYDERRRLIETANSVPGIEEARVNVIVQD
jgi:osmotically-inducible protein OsmY